MCVEVPQTLPDDIGKCHALIEAMAGTIRDLEARMDYLVRRLFGTRSERTDPAQLPLFDAPGEPAPEETPAEAQETQSRSNPKGHGRNGLPAELPRERIEYDLSPEEKICPCCGKEKNCIGEEVSEQLEYVPASLFVKEHVRLKYACPCGESGVAIAPKPAQPIEKGIAGPGLIAHVITSKYCDHLPLNRQESILARHGVEVSRKTMCDWTLESAWGLAPVAEAMKAEVLASYVIHTDDTPVQVQVPGGGHRSHRAFLWVYLGDAEHPYTVYDFTWTRSREGPEKFLYYDDPEQCYKGILQADAYAGYDRLYTDREILEAGCMAHARRKYVDARTADPVRAHEALRRIAEFYAVERAAREAGDDYDALRARRQEQSVPLLESFEAWVKAQYAAVLPKSPIGLACAYTLNHWTALTRFLDDGRIDIDNNAAERAIRPLVVGRGNWLFAGSKRGGEAAAIHYSLIQSAKRHGLDPFAYLRDLLGRIPTWPNSRIRELLPDRWKAAAERGE
jgi:transposase